MTNKYRSLEHKALEILSGKKLLTNKQLEESQTLDLKEDAVTSKKRVVVADPDKPGRRRVETTITGRLQFQTPARLATNKKRSEKAAAAKEEQKNQVVQESKEEFNEIIMEERKVSSQAANNFMNHRPYKNKNTKVIVTPEQTELYLHGNLIAKNSKRHGVSVSMAGWPTVTTKSRLNALGAKVKTKGGRHYMGSKEVDSKDWIKLGESQELIEGRIKELLTKDEEGDISPSEKKKLNALRGNKWNRAIAPIIDKIKKADWSDEAVEKIRLKDPKYRAHLKKKGKLTEEENLTEKSLLAKWKQKKKLTKRLDDELTATVWKGAAGGNVTDRFQTLKARQKQIGVKSGFNEEVEGLARTLSRGKEELPKMQDHRLKGQFSKNLLEAVQKVIAEKRTVFKDSFAEGLGKKGLNESSDNSLDEGLARGIDKHLLGSFFRKSKVANYKAAKAEKKHREQRHAEGKAAAATLKAASDEIMKRQKAGTLKQRVLSPEEHADLQARKARVNSLSLAIRNDRPNFYPESEVLDESAKQYGALLKKWKTAKGSEKAELKKKMDAIKANSKITAKAPAPKSVTKVSATKKQTDSDESTYLDKILKGQFPWGNVSKETAKAFRSKLMTIQKPRDRELAMKHAVKSADHFDQVMSGKALKEENGELVELYGKGNLKNWEQRGKE